MNIKSKIKADTLVATTILVYALYFFDAHVECDKFNNAIFNTNPYRHFRTLDVEGKYKLEWLVDLPGKRVIFNVTAETRGYVGFGLSKKGMMDGADIVMGGVMPNGRPYFSDKHTTRHLPPVQDKSQDWILHLASESRTHTFLSFSRTFETCDEDDLPIHGDVIGLIWAFGERDIEIDYHYQNRGSSFAYLLDPDLTPHVVSANQLTDPKFLDSEHFDRWLLEGSQLLPSKETAYICSIFKAPYSSQRHIIGFNTVLQKETDRRHIHHFQFHRCYVPVGQNADKLFGPLLNVKEECYVLNQPVGRIPTQLCTEVVYTWAVGQLPHFYPAHIGISVKNEYYMLQMHFDNPILTQELPINYYLEAFNTANIREHEASLLLVGELNPATPTILTPPNSLSYHVYGHCGSGCTRKLIPPSGIKVVATLHHTHLAGRGSRLIHIRDNKELPFISYDDNFNFNYQQIHVLSKEIVLLPGDIVIVQCEYENADTNGRVTVGGFSTRHEMCSAVLHYYDKIPNLSLCRSELRAPEYLDFLQIYNTTWSNERIEMIVQSPPQNAGLTVTEVGNYRVDWTIENRRRIQEYHRFLPQISSCVPYITPPERAYTDNRSNGWSTRARSQNLLPRQDVTVPVTKQNKKLLVNENGIVDPETEFVSVYPRDIVPYARPNQCVSSERKRKYSDI